MTDDVELKISGGVAEVTLSRPEALNAFDPAMARALLAVLTDIGRDDTVRAVLLQARGTYFCAGGDVRWFHGLAHADRETRQSGLGDLIDTVHAVIEVITDMPVPVLAVVQGGAAGFGISLMAACDIVVTTPDSRFSIAYPELGVPTDGGATWMLPRLMGLRKARELILLAERFDGEKAVALGLANRLVAAEALADAGRQMAEQLAAGPTFAYAQVKRLLRQSFETSLPQQLQAEQAAFLMAAETRDFREGVDAFAARRKARFSGA